MENERQKGKEGVKEGGSEKERNAIGGQRRARQGEGGQRAGVKAA